MILVLYKQIEAYKKKPIQWDNDGQEIAWENGEPVMLWKFKDQDGNLWNTETPLDGTEEDAASIILGSIQSA